jgi:hypothetical protein
MPDAMSGIRSSVIFGICFSISISCGSGSSSPGPTGPTAPTPGSGGSGGSAADPVKPPEPMKPPEPPPEPPKVDRPVELFPPAWKKVGVGQTISFSTATIDQDLDETRSIVTAMPKSATFDAITQTVTFKPTKADIGKAEFKLEISQPGRGTTQNVTWTIDVDPKPQPAPVAEKQSAVIETLLMIREPKRLEQVNKDWPFDKMLLVGAQGFKWQFTDENRAKLEGTLDKAKLFEGFLTAVAATHQNPRLDPKSPQFDKAVFGDPAAWRIVAFRPRIDKAWAELRVVYQAVKAPEPVFAMFRLRPVVEYVPALPRPDAEKDANNKAFLGMVAKHLLPGGAPSDKLMKDPVAHGKEVSALMTDVMGYDDSKTAPFARGFMIGIAVEARMGGGSLRNADGTYKSGDGWGWSALKPFQTPDGKTQQYVNVIIPGFWTEAAPNADKTTWVPKCQQRFNPDDPKHEPGWEVLCRKTMGFVDLPDQTGGKVKGARIDANNLYFEHKTKFMVANNFALEDGRRDVGEENGITCAQCHIRNFGMHDYSDHANVDPKAGTPKTKNHSIATLNFQIIPTTTWEAFTLEFLQHQECRGKQMYEQYLPEAGKGLTCPLAK